jgi:hypothetical protein
VKPNEYSWLGNELIREKHSYVIPEKHTVVDEYIGKLYTLKNSDLDINTKSIDMQLLINQAYIDIPQDYYRKRDKNEAEPTSYPSEYFRKWNHADNNNDVVKSALYILQDYIKSGSVELFFNGHWRRHHTSLVRNALIAFRKKESLTINDILNHFAQQLECTKTKPCGSLIKRLHFIAEMSGTTFNLCLRKETLSAEANDVSQYQPERERIKYESQTI